MKKQSNLFTLRALPRHALALGLGLTLLSTGQAQTLVFVDADAPGFQQDGQSWATAFTELQAGIDALAMLPSPGAPLRKHLLVAEGTYSTATGGFFSGGPADDRYRSFVVQNNMEIHGGFLGWQNGAPSSVDPDAPDGAFANTILTGEQTQALNSFHVLALDVNSLSADLGEYFVLDGCRIQDGRAIEPNSLAGLENRGAGIYAAGALPPQTLFENVTLVNNEALRFGGGAYLESTGQTIGMRFSTVEENEAKRGAGIYFPGGLLDMANVVIRKNGSLDAVPNGAPFTAQGGGIWIGQQTEFSIANGLIYDNVARSKGGGIYYKPSTNNPSNIMRRHYIRNCTITRNSLMPTLSGNLKQAGAGVHVEAGVFDIVDKDRQVFIDNSILYRNQYGRDVTILGQPSPGFNGIKMFVRYSNVGTWFSSVVGPSGEFQLINTISQNPAFVSTASENFNLRDGPGFISPCLDAGSDSLRGPDLLDIDNDPMTTLLPLDLGLDTRVIDLVNTPNSPIFGEAVDMGAYEANGL